VGTKLPRLRHAGGEERGFALLEALVAFAITALALSVLLCAALEGLEMVRSAGVYQTALALARSHLASAGRFVVEDGVNEGQDGPFRWRLEIAQEAETAPGPTLGTSVQSAARPLARLYRVSVAVMWGAKGRIREVRLETQRLGFLRPWTRAP
jgi:general secretion pathway protein I